MAPSQHDWLSLDEAARRLGVTFATLEKWIARRHLATHTAAGTTWVSSKDADKLSVGRANVESMDSARALLSAALRGDVPSSLAIVREVVASLGVAAAIESTIIPCLAEVGAKWDDGTYLITDEHIVSGVVIDVLARVREDVIPPLPSRVAASVVLGDDAHDVGARICQLCLEGAGFEARLIGLGPPIDDLLLWLGRHAEVSVLCCTVPMSANREHAQSAIVDIVAAFPNLKVFVGGAGSRRLDALPSGARRLISFIELDAVLRFE